MKKDRKKVKTQSLGNERNTLKAIVTTGYAEGEEKKGWREERGGKIYLAYMGNTWKYVIVDRLKKETKKKYEKKEID